MVFSTLEFERCQFDLIEGSEVKRPPLCIVLFAAGKMLRAAAVHTSCGEHHFTVCWYLHAHTFKGTTPSLAPVAGLLDLSSLSATREGQHWIEQMWGLELPSSHSSWKSLVMVVNDTLWPAFCFLSRWLHRRNGNQSIWSGIERHRTDFYFSRFCIMTRLSAVAWKDKGIKFSFHFYLCKYVYIPPILQMQRAGKPLSIIYFKINANEVMSRQWPSFTIKSDLFRKDLWCSFPSNGGGKEVESQARWPSNFRSDL